MSLAAVSFDDLAPMPLTVVDGGAALPVGMKLTAAAPLHVIVDALARVEWGPLSGRKFAFIRSLLQFLATTSRGTQFSKAGEIVITRAQIAQRCGYSSKTVQRNMPVFEDGGLVVWTRGAAVHGVPTPGRLRVNKRLLVQYIQDARAAFGSREARRHARTRARLERFHRLRMVKTRPKVNPRGDTTTHLSPLQGRSTARTTRARAVTKNPLKKVFTRAAMKKVQEMNVTIAEVFQYLPDVCTHRTGIPTRCNWCRSTAVNSMYEDRRARAAQAAAAANLSQSTEDTQPSEWWKYMEATYPGLTPRRWIHISMHSNDSTAARLFKESE